MVGFDCASLARTRRLTAGLLLLLAATACAAAPAECRQTTAAVEAMPWVVAEIHGQDRRLRLAATPETRRAGMQHLCPEAIARQPMLFVYTHERFARYHGFNVFAPLDLAWLDGDGRVIGTERLAPRTEVVSDDPVVAVLEAEAGSFERWGLTQGTVVELEQLPKEMMKRAR